MYVYYFVKRPMMVDPTNSGVQALAMLTMDSVQAFLTPHISS